MPLIEPGSWLLVLAALGAVASAAWVLFAKERQRLFVDQEIAWLVWHWFSGGSLDTSKSDAAGSVRRRIVLVVLRSVPPLVLLGPGLLAGILLGILVFVRLAVCAAVRLWWVNPIAEAVRPFTGFPPTVASRLPWKEDAKLPARKIVKFKRLKTGLWGVGIRVNVARGFVKSNKDSLVEAVEMRSGVDLGKVDHHWHLTGRASSVTFEPALNIPDRVAWTDRDGTPNVTIRELVEQTPAGTVWLGQGRDGVQVTYNLNRHPHVLISGPTGGGKSAVARSIAVQLMAQDPECEVINLDAKHLSQLWLRDLPGCRSLHNLAEIADVIVELGQEVRDRVAHADSLPRREVEPYVASLTRKVLIVEEAPTLMAELDMWWRSQHGKVACPAVQDLRMMLNMSRVAGFNILGLAQRADANAMGGGLARENYVLRILVSGYTKRAWEMLVPEVDYIPSVPKDGWAMVCHGAVGIETQCLYINDDEAEAWVAETRGLKEASESQPQLAFHEPPASESTVSVEVHEPGHSLGDTHDDTELITLRQAFTLGYIPAKSLSALQRAAGRAKEADRKNLARDPNYKSKFPAEAAPGSGPDGPRYWKEALVRWWEQLPRSAASKENYQPLVYFLNMNGPAAELRYGGAVKIGKTINLDQRLDSFAMHPDQKIKTIDCKDEADMDLLEKEKHAEFKDQRVFADRELFRVEGELARYLGVDGP